MNGSGTLTTYNTYVYTPTYKACIYINSGSTKTLTFTGATRIGNGSSNDPGVGGDGAVLPVIRDWGTGTINIQDRTWIMAGPYAKHGVWIGGKRTINCTGEATVYDNNSSSPGSCFYFNTSGSTLNFNCTGNFRTRGQYVVYSNYALTLRVTKGQFASKHPNKYMFCTSGKALTNYVGRGTGGATSFNYMTGYNNKYTNESVYGCYYLRVGF